MSVARAPTQVLVVIVGDAFFVVDARSVLAIGREEASPEERIVLSEALGRADGDGDRYSLRVGTAAGPRTFVVRGRTELAAVAKDGYLPLPSIFCEVRGGAYVALVVLARERDRFALALSLDRLVAGGAPS